LEELLIDMKEKFPSIYAYLNQEFSYHDIDDVVYDAANRLLDYLKSNTTFQLYNHLMNSEQDVRLMFEELADWWIDDKYLILTEDEQSMRNYNILTDRNTNKVIKDDVFRLLRQTL
jgi:hypothetical protein